MPLAVCATPIGNLEDITLRVLAELRVAELLPRLEAGERIALVSDAGLPGISDPGMRLVRAALGAGVDVTVLPGPSAVETALVASGLAAERYAFVGFLPRRAGERDALWTELSGWSWPTVAFESPQRLPASLRSLARAHPDRPVAVCRELTKRYEEVVRGTAAEVAERFGEAPRGEITLVIGPGKGATTDSADADAAAEAVARLVAGGAPRRVAAETVARLTGVSR